MIRQVRAFARSERRVLAIAALLVLLVGGASAWLAAPSPATHAAASAPGALSDLDADGIADLAEIGIWGTNASSDDSDGDGLPDAWEVRHARATSAGRCPDPVRADAADSCIAKGMSLVADLAQGTDPWTNDTDADGIPDAYEVGHAMDPLRDDAHEDPVGGGITNAERYGIGARADAVDSACSGMSDAQKLARGLDASVASTGGSGVPDGWAIHFGLDPRDPAIGLAHLDGDPLGLTVLEKARLSFALLDLCARTPFAQPPFARALDPRKTDSDGDGMPDAWEVRYALRPHDAADALLDADGDGVTNLQAYRRGACPDSSDCDGDGIANGAELDGWNVTVDGVTRRVSSDPMRAVSDGDILPDGAKRAGQWNGSTFPPLDPTTRDTDGDGIPDALEVTRYANVLDPTRSDTDGDGLADGEEVSYWDARAAADPARAEELCALCGTPPPIADPDVDDDGIPDGDEVAPAPRPREPRARELVEFPPSDPAAEDTDGDGLPDAWEREHARHRDTLGLWDLDPSRADSLADDPTGPACGDPCNDGARDLDDDGLVNRLERQAGADPHERDTDGDTIPDGWEATHGLLSGARFGQAAPPARGFVWFPAAGAPSRLSPTDATDASAPLARYHYVRWSRDGAAAEWERATQHGSRWRFDGAITWTFADAYRLGASPLRADSSGDGVPDLVKLVRGAPPVGAAGLFAVGDAADGARDADGDGHTNAREVERGSDPALADSDLGGLPDALEERLGLDALDPGDDASDGDADGDGLTNRAELEVYGTDPNAADTDGDGLLDGPDVVAPDPARADRFRALGIARHGDTFLGEFAVSRDPGRGCARKWSCTGDGLPDAWKVFYGLDASSYHPAGESLSDDGLTLLTKYRWGRPEGWSEETHGTWWLGLDPTRADTRRDGVRDDTRVDLDLDGLHDALGEDPDPYYGNVTVNDKAALFDALLARLAADARAPAMAAAGLELDSALPRELRKGSGLPLAGRVVTEGAAAGTIVLAQLVPVEDVPAHAQRSAASGDIIGLAPADVDGRFVIDAALTRQRSTDVPAGSVVFGQRRDGSVAWEADTGQLVPGRSYRLLLWSYAREGVAGAVWRSDETIVVTSAARLDSEPVVKVTPGASTSISVALRDEAGDPQPIARASALTLTVEGAEIQPTSTDGSNATFVVALPEESAEPVAAVLRYEGDARLLPGNATLRIVPTLDAAIEAAIASKELTPGGTIAIEGVVRDAQGRPAGGNVTARLANLTWNATLDAAGRFTIAGGLPAWTPLGARPLELAYEGDATRAPSTRAIAGVTVRARPAFEALVTNATLGSGGTIEGALLAAGAPVVDPLTGEPPLVRVRVMDLERALTPDAEGRFRMRIPPSLTAAPGVLEARVSTEASPLVSAAEAQLAIIVASPTRLSLEARDVTRGSTLLATGRIVTIDGEPAAGVELALQAPGGTVNATTGPDGRAVWRVEVPSSFPVGNVTLRASFAPAGALGGASADATIAVLPRLVARVEPLILLPGEPTVRGTLLTDAGAPSGIARLRVTFADATTSVPVGADGAFVVPVPASLPAVDAVPLRLAAEDGWAERFTLRLARPTALSLPFAGAVLTQGADAAFATRLVDDLGLPVIGREVELALASTTLARLVTDRQGWANATLRVPAGVEGNATLEARFGGSEARLPSLVQQSVVVRRATALAVEVLPEEVRVRATSHGAPVPNALVVVALPDAGNVTVLTDALGEAVLPFVVPAGSVHARLEETRSLHAATASASAATGPNALLAPDPARAVPPWLLPALVALVLAIVATLLFRSWRSRTSESVAAALDGAAEAFVARDEHAATVLAAYGALLRALHARGFEAPAHATPRELQALLADLALPAQPLETAIAAFEAARYGAERTDAGEAMAARDALRALATHVRGGG